MVSECASAWLLGLHLLTAHMKSGYEMATAMTLSTKDCKWSITAGIVSGYPAAPIMPLLVPSRRFELDAETHLRLSVLPKPPQHGQTTALHLSFEREF